MTKYRHVFYLGNNSAVVVENNIEGKQSTFATLSKLQRMEITLKGENYYREPSNTRLDPAIRRIL